MKKNYAQQLGVRWVCSTNDEIHASLLYGTGDQGLSLKFFYGECDIDYFIFDTTLCILF